MAHPNYFLNREFALAIDPAYVLMNTLTEMKKLGEKAVLIVNHNNKIQILIYNPFPAAFAVLDIESSHVFAPSNSDSYSLLFDINTWIQRLTRPTDRSPASSVSIRKLPGSMALFCLFGRNQQYISLGEAEFIIQHPLNPYVLACLVRVTMSSQQFIHFIYAFSNQLHDDSLTAIEMVIATNNIRWISRAGCFDHSAAQAFSFEGVKPGDHFRLRLRWNWPLFRMLCSASTGYERVELSVLQDPGGGRHYWFRLLRNARSYVFSYFENEPLPPH